VYALTVDPEGALLDYLEMFYNLRRTGKALTRLGVVDFATTIAPGLSDVLVTGKATEAARRRASRRADTHVYHAVVIVAPRPCSTRPTWPRRPAARWTSPSSPSA